MIFHIFIIDKSKGVIFVTLEMLENESLWYTRLDHKIKIKRYLGYFTKLLESFSCGNQIPSWNQSKWWEQLNRENVCKLDGLWTVVKLKEKVYMKGLLTIAWDTFSLWETLFPTSTASFSVTKSIVLSQKTNVCSAMNAIRESKSSHNTSRRSLVTRVTRVCFSRETKGMKIHRKLVTLISQTFHHFSRSSADNKRRIRSYGHL